MSEDLLDELEAINSIYGEDTIVRANDTEMDIYILSIPHHDVTLRLSFAPSYPDQPPDILGTETTGETSRKGHGAHVVAQAREALGWTFTPGSVCVFDLLQELENSLQKPNDNPVDLRPVNPLINGDKIMNPPKISNGCHNSSSLFSPPDWSLSEAVTCKKSVFIARACPVSSPAQAHAALANLLANDKRAANATHNINAYRIRSQLMSQTKDGPSEIIYQDCLDDGETAAGGRLLHLLQAMDVWNVFVVITRWYGGLQLGPDRFRIMSQVAREAVVCGGWIKGGGEEPQGGKDRTAR